MKSENNLNLAVIGLVLLVGVASLMFYFLGDATGMASMDKAIGDQIKEDCKQQEMQLQQNCNRGNCRDYAKEFRKGCRTASKEILRFFSLILTPVTIPRRSALSMFLCLISCCPHRLPLLS